MCISSNASRNSPFACSKSERRKRCLEKVGGRMDVAAIWPVCVIFFTISSLSIAQENAFLILRLLKGGSCVLKVINVVAALGTKISWFLSFSTASGGNGQSGPPSQSSRSEE